MTYIQSTDLQGTEKLSSMLKRGWVCLSIPKSIFKEIKMAFTSRIFFFPQPSSQNQTFGNQFCSILTSSLAATTPLRSISPYCISNITMHTDRQTDANSIFPFWIKHTNNLNQGFPSKNTHRSRSYSISYF